MMDRTTYIRHEVDRLFREWSVRTALAGAFLSLATAPLDLFAAPGLAARFLGYRVATALALALAALVISRARSPGSVRAMIMLGVAFSTVEIEVMILATGGHHSPYMLGMVLLAVVVLGVIPAGTGLATLVAATIFAGYLAPIVVWDTLTESWHFAVSTALLLCVLAAAVSVRRFHTGHIRREIGLRHELMESRERLERETAQHRESEGRLQLFAAAIEAAGEGVYLIGLDGRILYANPAAARMSARPREELVGLSVSELHRDGQFPAQVIIPALHRTGTWAGEVRGRGPGKEGFCYWLTASLVRDGAGEPRAMFGVLTDLTPQRRLEDERARAQRLDSVGVLAGGLAHDFNNLLTIVLGNLDLARLFAGGNAELGEALDHASEAALRAGDLTRQLITFSKGGQPVKRVADIGRLVRETVLFAASGSSLAAEFDIPAGTLRVEFDEGQMRQVVHNLVQNAREAAPGGGTLSAALRAVAIGSEEVPGLPAGRYIRLDITDTGGGIATEHLERIFDPYFSTKEMGTLKGRGLGLAVSYSIVRGHGGGIVAQSRPGQGTTVSVLLPEAAEADEEEAGDGGPDDDAPGRTASAAPPPSVVRPDGPPRGRVLVMDDEPLVLSLAGAALRQLGYEAELCGEGNAAVVRYQIALDAGRRFDAVILDLTVPGGMGGLETMARLRRIDPEVRAILSSGYAEDPDAPGHRAAGFAAFAGKPYSLAALREILERVV